MTNEVYRRLLARKQELLADKSPRKPSHGKSRLSDEQKSQIRQRYHAREPGKQIAKDFGISRSLVYHIAGWRDREPNEEKENV
jgi:DNA invertase Pin-like site-specific DNA recombinase